jgi:hypothetical protein
MYSQVHLEISEGAYFRLLYLPDTSRLSNFNRHSKKDVAWDIFVVRLLDFLDFIQ